ncbi:MAG: dockerin type I domain-containing protein [Candidatus Doudnabacteria bacterium]
MPWPAKLILSQAEFFIIVVFLTLILGINPSFVQSATISDDDVVEVTAIVPGTSTPTNGESGKILIDRATVSFSGRAFPQAKLTLLVDGQVKSVLVADQNGEFKLVINNLSYGNYQISIYAEDPLGLVSAPYTINIAAFSNTPQVISGVLLPPTIQSSRLSLRQGELLQFYGYATPGATVSLSAFGFSQGLGSTNADDSGFYRINIPMNFIPGIYSIRTKANLGSDFSFFSRPIQLSIYQTDFELPDGQTLPPPIQFASCLDYNGDNHVDLIDFSILLFWLGKPNPPINLDCNGDRNINITDFSLLMYYWTG